MENRNRKERRRGENGNKPSQPSQPRLITRAHPRLTSPAVAWPSLPSRLRPQSCCRSNLRPRPSLRPLAPMPPPYAPLMGRALGPTCHPLPLRPLSFSSCPPTGVKPKMTRAIAAVPVQTTFVEPLDGWHVDDPRHHHLH